MTHSRLPAPDSLIFDLDGTLWDTCDTCARGWNLVIERHGFPFRRVTGDDVRKVAGKSHDLCMRETFVDASEAELHILSTETAIEDNVLIARDGGVLFAGVRPVLRDLYRSLPLFIVSNCQAGYIEIFLEHSGLGTLIADFECWGNTGRPKPENLRSLIERNSLRAPWLVGDTAGDQEAARACRVPFVFAAYGFGDCVDPELRIETFAELPAAVAAAASVRVRWP